MRRCEMGGNLEDGGDVKKVQEREDVLESTTCSAGGTKIKKTDGIKLGWNVAVLRVA